MRRIFFLLAFSVASGSSELLFFTDFEDFSVGENQWAAHPKWSTNNTSPGVDAIDTQSFGGVFGKTASLGFKRPSTTRVRMLTPVAHNPITTGREIIEIETLLAVRDSTNGERDDFLFSLFHPSGVRLASIRLDNEDPLTSGSDFGFWREDGAQRFATGVGFLHEELYNLVITLDLSSNRWTASINGLPLFQNAPFSSVINPANLALAAVGFEWALTAISPSLYGDNFLFVGDLRIESFSRHSQPKLSITRNSDSSFDLRWFGFSGKTYRIESSTTLQPPLWLPHLPMTTFSTTEIKRSFRVNVSPSSHSPQFFRVLASE